MNQKDAIAKSAQIAFKLGRSEWEPRPFENDGWHACAILTSAGSLVASVMYDESTATHVAYAFGAQPDFLGEPIRRLAPQDAISALIEAIERHVNMMTTSLQTLKRSRQ